MDKERTQIDHIISKLGEKIKYLRTEKSLSLKDLSGRSGISAAAIHKIESNGIIPTITTMMKIADALGRDVNHFIEQAKEDKDVVFV
ncbi:MAG: helix-turn-helix domain-containing protein, partial [Candidatus Dadabacteria bacterium]